MIKNDLTNIRVYYEDTDAGGVVYYANYLKFAERARTEFLRKLDINQSQLAKQHDIIFVVRDVDMQLLKPARLDDLLTIETVITAVSAASISMQQKIICQKQLINLINIKIISIRQNFKPVKIPAFIRDKITCA